MTMNIFASGEGPDPVRDRGVAWVCFSGARQQFSVHFRCRIDAWINPENSPVIHPYRTAWEGLSQHLGTIAKILSSQKTLA
jgi:hypothetical protein